MISDYCDQFSGMIPVGFVLGFFVTMVVGRWWDQFLTIPWPANVALLISANLQVQLLPLRVLSTFRNISFLFGSSSVN